MVAEEGLIGNCILAFLVLLAGVLWLVFGIAKGNRGLGCLLIGPIFLVCFVVLFCIILDNSHTPATDNLPSSTWTGVWQLVGASTRLSLFQTNDTVRGFFDDGKGSINGRITNRTLKAAWELENTRGEFEVTLSGPNEFRGSSRNYVRRYINESPAFAWQGTRISDQPKWPLKDGRMH